jgi:hypothetical protein
MPRYPVAPARRFSGERESQISGRHVDELNETKRGGAPQREEGRPRGQTQTDRGAPAKENQDRLGKRGRQSGTEEAAGPTLNHSQAAHGSGASNQAVAGVRVATMTSRISRPTRTPHETTGQAGVRCRWSRKSQLWPARALRNRSSAAESNRTATAGVDHDGHGRSRMSSWRQTIGQS